MNTHQENLELREALSVAGLRYTAQREAVYQYLCSVSTHPTAEEVYQAVRQRIPRISLATVYKCLEALVACGKATKISSADGPARYDHRTDRHVHMRDLRTGEVRDLELPHELRLHDRLQAQLEDLLRQNGFRITDVRIELVGYFDKPYSNSSFAPA
ncbi:MAG: transcriptional repressor [Gemmatales bacterium]|nr:transcriptional repressor [Gemmatales bacterium]MDW8174187.1 transcriptional repressor [Gemmatales bacterium]